MSGGSTESQDEMRQLRALDLYCGAGLLGMVCCVCGAAFQRHISEPYFNEHVCGKECMLEKTRREFLSVMGKHDLPTLWELGHAMTNWAREGMTNP